MHVVIPPDGRSMRHAAVAVSGAGGATSLRIPEQESTGCDVMPHRPAWSARDANDFRNLHLTLKSVIPHPRTAVFLQRSSYLSHILLTSTHGNLGSGFQISES